MPPGPRLPFTAVALSTILALGAAVGTYIVLSDDDGSSTTAGTIELTPQTDRAGDEDGVRFTTFDGEEVALSSLQGRPVVVNFFASSCPPCITEMPDLEEVHKQLGDKVTFLGLAAAGDRPEDALALVKRTGVTYRTARDVDGSVNTALGGTILPTTVLLDVDGSVVKVHSGKLDADDLRSLIADELGISS